VILAHRMLKNGVPRMADYTLLTQSAVQYMDVDPRRLGLVPHTERYEYFGDVECFLDDRASGASAIDLQADGCSACT
jgi:hypothetical protein